MKIDLGFTVAGNRSSIEAAKRILTVLQFLGHEVLTSHLMSDDAWQADWSVAPEKIFARDMNWLAECDLFIAEVTGSSFGLGFETGYLLGATTKKTILILRAGCRAQDFSPDHREHPPKLRTGTVLQSRRTGAIGSEARVGCWISRSERLYLRVC
jgi:nucleoside 2-deoxyribosyltransferase